MSGGVRLLLAPAFGVSIGLCFTAAWLLLGRALTQDTLTATAFLAGAATASAAVALAAVAFMPRLAWSARLAGTFLILAAGTLGLTSFIMMLDTITAAHDLTEVPVRMVLVIVTISTAAALHNFLTLAGLAILPFALPVIVVFSFLIARDSR